MSTLAVTPFVFAFLATFPALSFIPSTVMSLSSMLRHTLAPILSEFLSVFSQLLTSVAALFAVIGIPHRLAIVMDVGQIVAQFLAVGTIAMVTPATALSTASAAFPPSPPSLPIVVSATPMMLG